jgi:hypothetical protein
MLLGLQSIYRRLHARHTPSGELKTDNIITMLFLNISVVIDNATAGCAERFDLFCYVLFTQADCRSDCQSARINSALLCARVE